MPVHSGVQVDRNQIGRATALPCLKEIHNIKIAHSSFAIHTKIGREHTFAALVVVVSEVVIHPVPELALTDDSVVVARLIGPSLIELDSDACGIERGNNGVVPINTLNPFKKQGVLGAKGYSHVIDILVEHEAFHAIRSVDVGCP